MRAYVKSNHLASRYCYREQSVVLQTFSQLDFNADIYFE